MIYCQKRRSPNAGGTCVKLRLEWRKQAKWMLCMLLCSAAMAAGSSAIAAEIPHEQTLESGIYTIDSEKYDRSMAVNNNGTKVNTTVVLKSKTIEKSQKFSIRYIADGEYTITSYAGSRKAVGTAAKVGSIPKLSNTKTRYYIDQNEDGSYTISPVSAEHTAFRAVSSKTVKLAEKTGSAAERWTFDSEVTEAEASVSRQLTKVMKVRPSGKYLGSGYRFAGASQCMGFGREIYYRLFGTQVRWNYNGTPKTSADKGKYTVAATSRSYSASNLKKLIAKASPGDVLQMDAPKMHTMIFISSDKTGFTVYDANWVGANRVSVRHVNYSAWRYRRSSAIRVLHAANYPAE